jgi:ketosteroid isomerase-like protein
VRDQALSKTAIDRDTAERIIGDMIDALVAGDAKRMAAHLADDVVFSGSSADRHPFNYPRQGKAACLDLMRAIVVAYESMGSTIHRFLIDGDQVALHRTSRLRNRGTGRSFDISICNFVRFRDGLIVEFSQYPDTAAFARLNAGD